MGWRRTTDLSWQVLPRRGRSSTKNSTKSSRRVTNNGVVAAAAAAAVVVAGVKGAGSRIYGRTPLRRRGEVQETEAMVVIVEVVEAVAGAAEEEGAAVVEAVEAVTVTVMAAVAAGVEARGCLCQSKMRTKMIRMPACVARPGQVESRSTTTHTR
jgi:hypothetical protein